MTNKLIYFIANWKMFGNFALVKSIRRLHKISVKFKKLHKKNKIVLCIPNTLIHFFSKSSKSSLVSVGAQNCHHYQKHGPFTGSVSALMLRASGAKYVILGHSENRSSGETNQQIKMKIQSALNEKLTVIFCIGETFKEKRNKKTFKVIKNQIKASLDKKSNFKRIIIAYEPVWSIGTGTTPKTHDLKKIFIFIKQEIKKNFGSKISPKIIYGGSVNDQNVKKFSLISEIDGFLIGGASKSTKKFIDIIKNYFK